MRFLIRSDELLRTVLIEELLVLNFLVFLISFSRSFSFLLDFLAFPPKCEFQHFAIFPGLLNCTKVDRTPPNLDTKVINRKNWKTKSGKNGPKIEIMADPPLGLRRHF